MLHVTAVRRRTKENGPKWVGLRRSADEPVCPGVAVKSTIARQSNTT